ncbi:hypothetical protein BXT84_01745 [Sulfobacillus thermotolerans]|uniref:GerMN domain-containing protein n=1 Tax=Sulfobacillus thermotolerans TaxID=338644 RepID=A0ABM6RNE7_9FIRM|nr:hypothetical protein BXT84_01745 [Sulfobacillus thermotolerans]
MSRLIRKWRIAIFVTPLLFLLTGCWDSKPIDHQGIVLMLSIRASKIPGQYHWRFVFPNVTLTPGALSTIKPDEEYYDIAVMAPNFADAVMHAQEKSARALYLGQLQGIIWNNRLTFRQLWPQINAINAAGTIPKTFWVMGADGRPLAEYMNYVSPQIVAPRIALAAYFNCIRCSPIRLGMRGWKFWSSAVSQGISPYVPIVELKQQSLTVRQIDVYPASGGPPVLYSPLQTQGFGYLTGKVQRLTLSVPWHGQTVSISRISDTRSLHTFQTASAINVRETLHVKGFIEDISGQNRVTLQDERSISHRAEQTLLHLCLSTIAYANKTHTDPFGYDRSEAWFHPHAGFLPIHATLTVVVTLYGEGLMR